MASHTVEFCPSDGIYIAYNHFIFSDPLFDYIPPSAYFPSKGLLQRVSHLQRLGITVITTQRRRTTTNVYCSTVVVVRVLFFPTKDPGVNDQNPENSMHLAGSDE